MKNTRLCMMTLATVTALCSAQAMAAETFELQGERLARVILGKSVPFSRVYVMPVSVQHKIGPDTLEFPRVDHCFENRTRQGNFQLEIEAGLSAQDALDPTETARVAVHVKDPNQDFWVPRELSSPQAAESGGFTVNRSSARAEISIDPTSDSTFKKYVVALEEVRNLPEKICMELEFSRGLGSVGIRSIRLVPVR